eukprot:6712664-Heterocapsa_arctica.AAC.1
MGSQSILVVGSSPKAACPHAWITWYETGFGKNCMPTRLLAQWSKDDTWNTHSLRARASNNASLPNTLITCLNKEIQCLFKSLKRDESTVNNT